jgi:hypothetical protein
MDAPVVRREYVFSRDGSTFLTSRPIIRIAYEFNLEGSCGCVQWIDVYADTYEPVAGEYRCPMDDDVVEPMVPVGAFPIPPTTRNVRGMS